MRALVNLAADLGSTVTVLLTVAIVFLASSL